MPQDAVHLLYDDETKKDWWSRRLALLECLLMAHSSLVDREMNVFHCVARIQGSTLFAPYNSPNFFLEIDRKNRDNRDDDENIIYKR
jgi:hypothetical protein